MTIDRVLIPIDFSSHSHAALALGAQIARSSGAHALLVHVDPAAAENAPAMLPQKVWDQYRHDRSRALTVRLEQAADEARRLAPGLRVKSWLAAAEPATAILEAASHNDADLIVMGSHGAGATEQLLFGSVAARVSRKAPCPVLVTRAGQGGGAATGRFERPVVGIDYSRFSTALLRFACALASPNAVIDAVHVWRPPVFGDITISPGLEWPDLEAEMTRAVQSERERLEKFCRESTPAGCSARGTVATGRPAHRLIERVDQHANDLIVVGAHGRNRATELILGTVADRLLRHAPVPVLLVPEAALARPSAAGDGRGKAAGS